MISFNYVVLYNIQIQFKCVVFAFHLFSQKQSKNCPNFFLGTNSIIAVCVISEILSGSFGSPIYNLDTLW